MTHPFHIVDVFAEERYAGNQLAVVRNAGDLSAAEMARIANEMNYSETTFVESTTPTDEGYPVRIFTPERELPFAGHPTLGTAFVLREAVLDDDTDGEGANATVPLSLGVGRVPVTVEGEGERELFWMDQPNPSFASTIEPTFAASVVSLETDDLDGAFAPHIVSTGLPTLIVALESRSALRRARIDEGAYERLLDATDAENVLGFCRETVRSENDLHVRVFAPVHGVPEDPATGSSNGCLAAYLARERYFGDSTVDARVEQGYELDRPSLLYLRASDTTNGPETGEAIDPTDERNGNGDGDDDGIDVQVGGRVIPVADGRLL